MQRLERLERNAMNVPPAPFRATILLIGARDGKAEPWDPRWAEGGDYSGERERIQRQPDESPEAFEARARAQFPAGLLLMGCRQ